MITKNEIEAKTNELVEMYKSYFLTGDTQFTNIKHRGIQEDECGEYYVSAYDSYSLSEAGCNIDMLLINHAGVRRKNAPLKFQDDWYIVSYHPIASQALHLLTNDEMHHLCKRILSQYENGK